MFDVVMNAIKYLLHISPSGKKNWGYLHIHCIYIYTSKIANILILKKLIDNKYMYEYLLNKIEL